jgi:transposase
MGQIVVVGLEIAKSVFQVHGVDRDGGVVVRRRLRRSRVPPFFATVEPCRIGIEACAGGHYWARELSARARCQADRAELREALRQTPEERCGRR